MKDLVNQNKLMIVNLTTTIPPVNVLEIMIDEKRTCSTISDHNMINLEINLEERTHSGKSKEEVVSINHKEANMTHQ